MMGALPRDRGCSDTRLYQLATELHTEARNGFVAVKVR